jgi:NADP-reducing hydrogenase subunit HndB
MGKINRNELKLLREKKKEEFGFGSVDSGLTYILVGMGTSGIAAGARETFARLKSGLEMHGLTSVVLKQTGSLGLDHAEPTVEVRMPGMPPTIYGKVDVDVAAKIIHKHILEKNLVNAHVFDRPAVDIVSESRRSATEAK